MINKPSSQMIKALHQMYFFTGYPVNYFSNSLPHDNRYWFDFVQAELVFKSSIGDYMSKEIQEEIIRKYSEGVTYFHRHVIGVIDTWDLEQKYVNHDFDLL